MNTNTTNLMKKTVMALALAGISGSAAAQGFGLFGAIGALASGRPFSCSLIPFIGGCAYTDGQPPAPPPAQAPAPDLTDTNNKVITVATGVTEVKKQVDDLKADHDRTKTDLTNLKNDHDQTKTDLAELKADHDQTKDNLAATDSRLDDLIADHDQTKLNVAAADSRLDDLEAEENNTQERVTVLENRLDETDRNVDDLTAGLNDVQQQLAASGFQERPDGNKTSGMDHKVDGTDNFAAGASQTISGSGNTLQGQGSTANGNDNTLTGQGNTASGNGNHLAGKNITADGDNNALHGGNIKVQGSNNSGIGSEIEIVANNGSALGHGARVTADNATAIGANSVADRANTVSVGAADNERVIANVADPVFGTDAVNKRTLDRETGKLRSEIKRVGALSSANAQAIFSAAGLKSKHRLGAGIGFQDGKTALALAYQYAPADRKLTYNVSIATTSDGNPQYGAGIGLGW